MGPGTALQGNKLFLDVIVKIAKTETALAQSQM